MNTYESAQKLQELFDASKSALIIPVIFSFLSLVGTVIQSFFPNLLKIKCGKAVKKIADESYISFYISMVGVAMFAHYIAASIIVYLTISLYVLFICLPLLHRNKPKRKRVIDLVFLSFLMLLSLVFVFDVNFQ